MTCTNDGVASQPHLLVELARRFATDGMLAYVQLIQKKEKELGCDVLTHQKWSGANYIDRILSSASPVPSAPSSADDLCSRFFWVIKHGRYGQRLDRAYFLRAP
jgi:isocitrate lyase